MDNEQKRENPFPETGEWVVSQQFMNSGDWLVHKPGGNRVSICRCLYREDAERIADALNKAQNNE